MFILKNLTVRRGDFELSIPDLTLPLGQVSVIYGDSGSGKSTLIEALTGQLETSKFYWECRGEILSDKSVGARRLGVVFQDLGLFPHMTGRENIEFAAKARGLGSKVVDEFLKKYGAEFMTSEFLGRRVTELSGGERQRVALLRSVVAQPKVVLWDEPFSALQAPLKERLRKFLKSFVAERGIVGVLISHDPRDLEYFAPHIHQLEGGRLLDVKPSGA